MTMGYKRNSVESNDSVEILKSPTARISDQCFLDTLSKNENKKSDVKNKKDSIDRLYSGDPRKFAHTKNFFADKVSTKTKDSSDKRISINTESNFSGNKSSKRQRQIMSPECIKNDFDEGMNLNSFSSRTIEEYPKSRKMHMIDPVDKEKDLKKFIRMDYNPSVKESSKAIKVPFKLYNKADHVMAKKYFKNNKNLSYCSNDEEASVSSKKRHSVSGNNSNFSIASKKASKPATKERSKIRSISSASTIKTFESLNKNSLMKDTQRKAVKEFDVREQVSNIFKNVEENKQMKLDTSTNNCPAPFYNVKTPRNIDETLQSIYSTIEENSVCNKRHDVSVVEADGILDQINSRMMKLHFEMIYKNLEKDDCPSNDFSFEIDNMNNMIVPKNSDAPFKNKNFVQLPNREDLYKENETSKGKIQWIADTQTVKIFPQSPTRNPNGSISSPFTSPQTNPRSPGSQIASPNSCSRPKDKSVKCSMYQYTCSSTHYYKNSLIVQDNEKPKDQMAEIKDHDDNEKDKNDDIELDRELEYSQNFITFDDANNSSSNIERSFESRMSECTDSINTNNNSFMSGLSQYGKQGKEKRFMNFVREKVHVLEESQRLLPSLNTQSHLKLYKPSCFSIFFHQPLHPVLESHRFKA